MPKPKKKLGTPPQEISQNLNHEETDALSLLDRRNRSIIDGRSLRRSPRTRQFSMRITDELYEIIYSTAKEEKIMLTELAEKAVREYVGKKERAKKNKKT